MTAKYVWKVFAFIHSSLVASSSYCHCCCLLLLLFLFLHCSKNSLLLYNHFPRSFESYFLNEKKSFNIWAGTFANQQLPNDFSLYENRCEMFNSVIVSFTLVVINTPKNEGEKKTLHSFRWTFQSHFRDCTKECRSLDKIDRAKEKRFFSRVLFF